MQKLEVEDRSGTVILDQSPLMKPKNTTLIASLNDSQQNS